MEKKYEYYATSTVLSEILPGGRSLRDMDALWLTNINE